jgi:uroporphyrinogen-III synthase
MHGGARQQHKASPLIALTRPAGGNQRLAAAIYAHLPEARLIDWPLLAFTPPSNPAATMAIINQITLGDWLIFVSPRAVHFAHALRPLNTLPACRWAAVGAATVAALQAVFPRVPPVLSPTTTQDSEGLLRTLPLDAMLGQRVWIFRGDTGRELLIEALSAQGAHAEPIPVYRRLCAPGGASAEILPALWVLSAPSALTCLRALADGAPTAALARRLLHCGLIVINERTEHQARALGFTGIITRAHAPDDAALAQAVTQAIGQALAHATDHPPH